MWKRLMLVVGVLLLTGCETSWRTCSQIKTEQAISHGGLTCTCCQTAAK